MLNRKPLALAVAGALGMTALPAHSESFVIQDIVIEGLSRISPSTVFTYLPVKAGDEFDEASSAEVLRTLYKTGLFEDASIMRRGNVLVVSVEERPAIGEISIKGNSDISTDDLNEALKGVGIARGRVFNRSVLDRLENELVQQYFSRGKYNVKVKTDIKNLERNRVAIDIDIKEGDVARIRRVNIVGNKTQKEERLIEPFNSGTTPWWKFWTSRDQYSKQKLAGDLETLRSEYLDRGFLQFAIESTQVAITPDKRDIYITINIDEGDQFSVSDVKLAGNFVVGEDQLQKLVLVKKGEIFSRAKLVKTTEAINKRLGDEGYAFANVNPVPDIDKEHKKVALTFFVDPGKRVYVRRVNFYGNQNTRDEVFRRETRQMEGGYYSSTSVDLTKRRLQRLPFVANVEVETKRVPGVDDQVDLDVRVTERLAGNFAIGAGYSQSQGPLFNVSLSQNNFLGTGKEVSIAFNNSDVNQIYSLSYTNPYYTVNGVSRGFNARFTKTDAANADVAAFNAKRYGAGVNFGFPLSEDNTLRFTAGFEGNTLNKTNDTPLEILDFLDKNGDNFLNFPLTAEFAYDSRNKAVFADRGGLSKVSLEVTTPGSDLTYFKLDFQNLRYIPITTKTTLLVNSQLSYGDGYSGTSGLPFYENFYAGGYRSVRGYRSNSLGPRVLRPDGSGTSTDSKRNTDPFGGSFRVIGQVEYIFPLPLIENLADKVRVSTFFDFGNVFANTSDFSISGLRTSAGVGATWITPVGALSFSLAQPLNAKKGDDKEVFQFNLGTLF